MYNLQHQILFLRILYTLCLFLSRDKKQKIFFAFFIEKVIFFIKKKWENIKNIFYRLFMTTYKVFHFHKTIMFFFSLSNLIGSCEVFVIFFYLSSFINCTFQKKELFCFHWELFTSNININNMLKVLILMWKSLCIIGKTLYRDLSIFIMA